VAIARNGVIGSQGKLPWHIPEDLQRFRALTMGHHIIMGRRTYQSIGRLLPGRTSVIVTRNPGFSVPGAVMAASVEQAITQCAGDEEVFVIGGAEIYRAALPAADRIYLTDIKSDVKGDTRFPDFDRGGWREVSREPLTVRAGSPACDFVVLDRIR
jgi:dihydrofolate reductase